MTTRHRQEQLPAGADGRGADPDLPGPDRQTSRLQGCLRELAQLAPPALLLAVVLQVSTRFEAEHRELALAALAVVLTQVLPGALVWRVIRPIDGWLMEDIGLGLAIGAALAVPTQMLGVALGAPWVNLVVPAMVVGALLGAPRSRRRILSRRSRPLPWLWGAAVAATTLLQCQAVFSLFREPVRWTGWAMPYVDMPFHQALAAEFLHRFPPVYPQVASDPLNYHWFTYAWTAQIASVSGTDVAVLLWRFQPSLLAIAVPLVTALVAMRLSGRPWVGAGAAAVGFILLDVAPWAITDASSPLHNPLSATQGFGLLIFVPLLSLLALRWRREIHSSSVVLLALMLIVAGGAKGSMLPVLVAGCLLACAFVLVFRRDLIRVVSLDTALTITALVVLKLTMFGGAAGGLHLTWVDDFIAIRGTALVGDDIDPGSAIGVTAGLLYLLSVAWGSIGVAGALATRSTRRDPVMWLLLGASISGFCAILFLTHPGQSQWYFFRSAEAPLAILAAWGLGVALHRLERPARTLWAGSAAGAAALFVTHRIFTPAPDDVPGLERAFLALVTFAVLAAAGCFAATLLVRGAEPLARRLAVLAMVAITAAGITPAIQNLVEWEGTPVHVSAEPQPGALHSSEVTAYRWIRDHSDVDDLVMTNRHCRVNAEEPCGHRRFFLAAYSERRVLVEGWSYTTGARRQFQTGAFEEYDRVPFWDEDLLALNDRFIEHPTAEAADELYDLGVRWVAVHKMSPHARTLEPYARLRLQTKYVTVYELVPR